MKEIRVAAYCRVSTNHEEQDSRFEAHISYYEKLITDHKDYPSCSSDDQMNPNSRQNYTENRDYLIAQRYDPYKKCNL